MLSAISATRSTTCRSVSAVASYLLRDLIGFGTKRAFRRTVTRQSSGCEWTIRDHPDLLIPAERQHLPLLFAVDEVQVILHREEAGPPMLLGHVQRLLELPANMADAPIYRALPALTTSCSASIAPRSGFDNPSDGSGRGPRSPSQGASGFSRHVHSGVSYLRVFQCFFLSNDRVGPGTDDQALVPARVFKLFFPSRCNL